MNGTHKMLDGSPSIDGCNLAIHKWKPLSMDLTHQIMDGNSSIHGWESPVLRWSPAIQRCKL
jgi:hypothetical protein